MNLACYASDPAHSRGRRVFEADAPTRSVFQRDRDRIVHSTAFRRLVYKTQVFLNHEGDLFRTRLTHSLEVAQLGRSVARTLKLSEDLVEAIALAHDLGHTPFGHAGQEALNECMAKHGGFEHNLQSLRVVDHLEERYPDFNGLNLCFETREGILKHCSVINAVALEAQEPVYEDKKGGVGLRFLERTQPSLEAQLCNLADEIAYNAHDIDDGVRSGLITIEQLRDIPLFDEFRYQALSAHMGLADPAQSRRLLYESIRLMLSAQIYDVTSATQLALQMKEPRNRADVSEMPRLVQFSPSMRDRSQVLKAFLTRNLYRHPRVVSKMDLAQQIVRDLFEAYCTAPLEMLADFAVRSLPETKLASKDSESSFRSVADYIAGMTDRFAAREHERLTGQRLLT